MTMRLRMCMLRSALKSDQELLMSHPGFFKKALTFIGYYLYNL